MILLCKAKVAKSPTNLKCLHCLQIEFDILGPLINLGLSQSASEFPPSPSTLTLTVPTPPRHGQHSTSTHMPCEFPFQKPIYHALSHCRTGFQFILSYLSFTKRTFHKSFLRENLPDIFLPSQVYPIAKLGSLSGPQRLSQLAMDIQL